MAASCAGAHSAFPAVVTSGAPGFQFIPRGRGQCPLFWRGQPSHSVLRSYRKLPQYEATRICARSGRCVLPPQPCSVTLWAGFIQKSQISDGVSHMRGGYVPDLELHTSQPFFSQLCCLNRWVKSAAGLLCRELKQVTDENLSGSLSTCKKLSLETGSVRFSVVRSWRLGEI